MTETENKTNSEPLTVQEETRQILESYRRNPFFSKIDHHILIREMFPYGTQSFLGVSWKDVKDRCNDMYNQIWKAYETLSDDEKPDKKEYFEEALEDGRKQGYTELIKVLELLYIANNKPNK